MTPLEPVRPARRGRFCEEILRGKTVGGRNVAGSRTFEKKSVGKVTKMRRRCGSNGSQKSLTSSEKEPREAQKPQNDGELHIDR